jgi:hypothetical protein
MAGWPPDRTRVPPFTHAGPGRASPRCRPGPCAAAPPAAPRPRGSLRAMHRGAVLNAIRALCTYGRPSRRPSRRPHRRPPRRRPYRSPLFREPPRAPRQAAASPLPRSALLAASHGLAPRFRVCRPSPLPERPGACDAVYASRILFAWSRYEYVLQSMLYFMRGESGGRWRPCAAARPATACTGGTGPRPRSRSGRRSWPGWATAEWACTPPAAAAGETMSTPCSGLCKICYAQRASS